MREIFLLLTLAFTSWAVDPIVGTWKLDLGRSKFPTSDATPKEQTEVYRDVGGSIEFTLTRTGANGSIEVEKLSWPTEGGAVKVQQLPPGLPVSYSLIETLIAPGEWYVTTLIFGKQIASMHKVISSDGKTMRQTVKVRSQTLPDGRKIGGETLQVFDRQ
jgi:hypothetical protein